jgi:hypothetical protein
MATIDEITPLIVTWQNAEKALEIAKEKEKEARLALMAAAFPDAERGTNTLELTHGYVLKGVKKVNFNLKNTKEGHETETALEAIEKIGNRGAYIADDLVSWKPSLSLTTYQKLDPLDPQDRKIKEIIDTVLTTSEGLPTLEIVKPKK